jgi:Aerobic-type carbon monoxide dehydrogenase, large subunit CoxL/CutL homologs
MSITQERTTSIIGTRMLRREDPALLTGEAKFTNDLVIPGALHLAVLRSPYAHARIKSINVSDALAMPGVLRSTPARICATRGRHRCRVPGQSHQT